MRTMNWAKQWGKNLINAKKGEMVKKEVKNVLLSMSCCSAFGCENKALLQHEIGFSTSCFGWRKTE